MEEPIYKKEEFRIKSYLYVVMSDGTIWKYDRGTWVCIEKVKED